jgi:hypothetical protein
VSASPKAGSAIRSVSALLAVTRKIAGYRSTKLSSWLTFGIPVLSKECPRGSLSDAALVKNQAVERTTVNATGQGSNVERSVSV